MILNDKATKRGKRETFTKTWANPGSSALPITREELANLGIPLPDQNPHQVHGHLETRGPWQLPVSYRALCTRTFWDFNHRIAAVEAYGVRTLSRPRQEGYALEGLVSVNGRSVRGFTSSQLFNVEGYGLVNVATIHACKP